MARPSDYSPEIADRICEALADGASLREICREDGMPNRTTVWRWLGVNEAFRNQYARAREDQLDVLADELLDIADDARSDVNEDGEVNHDAIARSRLRVDTRKWVLSKMRPGTYGDKIAATVDVTVGYADKLEKARKRARSTD